jgi:hypothetical protein
MCDCNSDWNNLTPEQQDATINWDSLDEPNGTWEKNK